MTASQRRIVEELKKTFGHCLIKEVPAPHLTDVLVVYDYAGIGGNADDHRPKPQVTTISPTGKLRTEHIRYKSPTYREWRESLAAAKAAEKES